MYRFFFFSPPFCLSCLRYYFYLDARGEQLGPLTVSELKEGLKAGTLTAQTMLWNEQIVEWKPLSAIPYLVALIPTAATSSSVALPAPPLFLKPPRDSLPGLDLTSFHRFGEAQSTTPKHAASTPTAAAAPSPVAERRRMSPNNPTIHSICRENAQSHM